MAKKNNSKKRIKKTQKFWKNGLVLREKDMTILWLSAEKENGKSRVS